MRLTNLLSQPGGVHEQGREVTLRLRYRGSGGLPHQREVVGQMLPISEVEAVQIERAARQVVESDKAQLGFGEEYLIQLLRVSLRDPGDLSQPLIDDERDLQALRDGLVALQYPQIMEEYKALIRSEYPEVVTDGDEKKLEKDARDFSASDQPARG